ncbi:hypothetical protein KBD08_04325, partial [Candidatus Babeliales bacterium]|nr:hypothetical protein [Candidatus Babeliales bacterium]
PTVIARFILCSVLAVTISTVNRQSLISATLITPDLYGPLTGHSQQVYSNVLFTRLAVLVIPLLSLIIAWNQSYSVLELVLYAWSGLGCTFGPMILMSLYCTQLNRFGMMAGIITGALLAITWPLNSAVPTLVVGYIASPIVAYVTTKLTR